MRFWDNDFDRQFDEALDELIKEERTLLALAEENQQMVNIGNPQTLIGAQ